MEGTSQAPGSQVPTPEAEARKEVRLLEGGLLLSENNPGMMER